MWVESREVLVGNHISILFQFNGSAGTTRCFPDPLNQYGDVEGIADTFSVAVVPEIAETTALLYEITLETVSNRTDSDCHDKLLTNHSRWIFTCVSMTELGCIHQRDWQVAGWILESPRHAQFTQKLCCEKSFDAIDSKCYRIYVVQVPTLQAFKMILITKCVDWNTEMMCLCYVGSTPTSPSKSQINQKNVPSLRTNTCHRRHIAPATCMAPTDLPSCCSMPTPRPGPLATWEDRWGLVELKIR